MQNKLLGSWRWVMWSGVSSKGSPGGPAWSVGIPRPNGGKAGTVTMYSSSGILSQEIGLTRRISRWIKKLTFDSNVFLEGLGLFVLEWCQPVLPVLSGVRTYIDEPGGHCFGVAQYKNVFCGFLSLGI